MVSKNTFKIQFFHGSQECEHILCSESLTNVPVLRLEKTSTHVLERNKQHYQMDGNIARQTQFIIKSISLLMDSVLTLH